MWFFSLVQISIFRQLLKSFCPNDPSFFFFQKNDCLINITNGIFAKTNSLCLNYFLAEGGCPDTTFIEDAVHVLLKTRRILKCSYPYGFFLEPKSTKKEIFELMQVRYFLITFK